jgi:hypothetical protein
MKCRFCAVFLILWLESFSQTQTCPANINFATGDLTHWFAYTGNNELGNGPTAILMKYDSTQSYPEGTIGSKSIQEYDLNTVLGIKVITTSYNDQFGSFPTIPTINGYAYNYSILLGSTAITRGNPNNGSGGGGYIRGVSYKINVPSGPVTEPYTMTYAYAMVLENGTHVSSQQPLISATLRTPAGIISCASPSYYLPTLNNVTEGGRGATLDSAAAKRNGFKVSPVHSPNDDPAPNGTSAGNLQDVWTKGWTEVTFDLSPYRGQQVSLTFEADNCIPGGHFAYGYIAIRNSCAGLMISGDTLVCNNSFVTYSVPSLAGAIYNWIIPDTWTVVTSDTSNIIQIKTSSLPGSVSVREKNSCADLKDTIQIKTLPSPVGGILNGSTAVCTGINTSVLSLINYSGVIKGWLQSTDNQTWSDISDTTASFTPENLDTTTFFRVQVGKGDICPPDSSSAARIQVDHKSIGGQLNPPEATICADQSIGEILILNGNLGSVQNWQFSTDGTNWTDTQPLDTSATLTVQGITSATQYRLVDKNGACPPDTSTIAKIAFDPVEFPRAAVEPADTTICFGTPAFLNAIIETGSSYSWSPFFAGSNNVSSIPFQFQNTVIPASSTAYILRVMNNGCPNALLDTFKVNVLAQVVVSPGNDTSVVVGEPLQFHAVSSDAGPDSFSWTPATDLSNPSIPDPVAVYHDNDNTVQYLVKAITPFGCEGQASVTVKIFKTKPDIFVPNAFTPGLSVNSIFRPIPVGISSLDYFRIYNRLGQLVYNTSALGSGWDGRLNGVNQDSGGYVWMVKGTDYTGNIIAKKGIMVLVR